MNEPVQHGLFKRHILSEYVQLHATIVAAQKDKVEFMVGAKFDANNWDTFANGTKNILIPLWVMEEYNYCI